MMFEILKILKFEFQIIQTKLDGEITKTKFTDLNEFYNFVVDDFSIWNHLLSQNIGWSCDILKLKFWTV